MTNDLMANWPKIPTGGTRNREVAELRRTIPTLPPGAEREAMVRRLCELDGSTEADGLARARADRERERAAVAEEA